MLEQLPRPNLTDFFILFAKITWHDHFLSGNFFAGGCFVFKHTFAVSDVYFLMSVF